MKGSNIQDIFLKMASAIVMRQEREKNSKRTCERGKVKKRKNEKEEAKEENQKKKVTEKKPQKEEEKDEI